MIIATRKAFLVSACKTCHSMGNDVCGACQTCHSCQTAIANSGSDVCPHCARYVIQYLDEQLTECEGLLDDSRFSLIFEPAVRHAIEMSQKKRELHAETLKAWARALSLSRSTHSKRMKNLQLLADCLEAGVRRMPDGSLQFAGHPVDGEPVAAILGIIRKLLAWDLDRASCRAKRHAGFQVGRKQRSMKSYSHPGSCKD